MINSLSILIFLDILVSLTDNFSLKELPLVVASPICDNKKHVKNIHFLFIISLSECVIDDEWEGVFIIRNLNLDNQWVRIVFVWIL